MSEATELLRFMMRLADGGTIVSSAALTPWRIALARAADRMFVTPDGYGFVYVPGPMHTEDTAS